MLFYSASYRSSATIRSRFRSMSTNFRDTISAPRFIRDGNLHVKIPLPGKLGLTPISISLKSTIGDLLNSFKRLDPSSQQTFAVNNEGKRIAASTRLDELICSDLFFDIGDSRVKLKKLAGHMNGGAVLDAQKYSELKQHLLNLGKGRITMEFYEQLCAKIGADKHMTLRWLEVLRVDGFAAVVGEGSSGTIILQPGIGNDFKRQVADVLRRDDELLEGKVAAVEKQLQEAIDAELQLSNLRNKIVHRAMRSARLKSAGVLAFLTAQFSGLFYLVYEVYSWDIMEPASYFLMLSYSAGGALYFSFKKKEPTYDNFLENAIKKQETKLAPEHGYSIVEHEKAKETVTRIRRALDVIRERVHRD